MTPQELLRYRKRIINFWEAGKIRTPLHFPDGNEKILVQYFSEHVRPGDWVVSYHRNMYHWLLHTGDFLRYKVFLANENSMHLVDRKRRFVSTGIVAGGCGIAVGLAKAGLRTHCFVGDGATDQGWFWEALRYAQAQDLPITFVVEDNNRSVCTNCETRWGKRIDLSGHKNVFYYTYTPKFPHVGTGKWINW